MASWLLDPGHGGSNLGVSYNNNIEKNDNLKIALKIGQILKDNGEDVFFTRIDDSDLTLLERISIGNSKKYDYFISFHRNSFSPEENIGVEIFYYKDDSTIRKLCESLKGELQEIFNYRGTNQAELSLLKKIKSDGILIELGFIDSSSDNQIFNNRIDEIAEAISRACLKEVGKFNEEKTIWRVCVGAFEGYEEAEKLMKEVNDLGYNACIIPLNE